MQACAAFGVRPWEWEAIEPQWQAAMIAHVGLESSGRAP